MTGTVISRSLLAIAANILLSGVFGICSCVSTLKVQRIYSPVRYFRSGVVFLVRCSVFVCLSVSHIGPSPVIISFLALVVHPGVVGRWKRDGNRLKDCIVWDILSPVCSVIPVRYFVTLPTSGKYNPITKLSMCK